MNLLFINYMETTAPGGINSVVREVGRGLALKGYQVTVLQPDVQRHLRTEISEGIEIRRVKAPLSGFLYGFDFALRALKNEINRSNPDVVHIHGYHTLFSAEALRLLKGTGYPIVYSPHFDVLSHNTFAGRHLWDIFNRYIGRQNFEIANKVICASNFERTNVERTFELRENRIQVIPHGVNFIHTESRKKKHYVALIYFGYLLELKGVQYILMTVSELKHKLGKHVTLTIIGEGDYKPRLVALAKRLNIEDCIRWLPFLPRDQLFERVADADIFLLLSRSENYGITVAEALSLGIPCVVAKTTALREFTHEKGCFGVDYPPDPKEVAELIVDIYGRDVQIGPLSNKISTWEEVTRAYERVYRRCLKANV